jgi:hypothetical protein
VNNWKTTAAAAASAVASFVLFAQNGHLIDFPRWLTAIAMFMQIGGLTAFGVAAADAKK